MRRGSLSTYYWQVEAIDGFGARTLSDNGPFSFDTDNQNSIGGIIIGLVHSDVSFAGLIGAQVNVNLGGGGTLSAQTDSDGAFILVLPNVGTFNLSSSLSGFDDAVANNVVVGAGKTTSGINIGMSPAQTGPRVNLAATITANSSSLNLGNTLIYSISVSNNGPDPASDVILIQALPGTALFVSAPDCNAPITNTLSCSIGALAVDASANFSVTVTPQSAGSATSSISVESAEFDENDANNQASLQVQVVDVNQDSDGDGVLDTIDNCVFNSNADQLDTDGDGQGDVCDTDDDGDGVLDVNDAFPLDSAESVDTDSDGIGNNADTDDDDDGLSDAEEVILKTDPIKQDSDSDGVNDGDEVNAGRNPVVNEAVIIQIINSIMD